MQMDFAKRFAKRLSQNDIPKIWDIYEIYVYLLLTTMARYSSQAKEETAYESMQWSKRRKQVPTRIVKMLTHWLTKE